MAAHSGGPARIAEDEILHVIVGHSLPVLFMNAVTSFRAICPDAELLVIDNASPQSSLRRRLADIGRADPRTEVVLRNSNHRGSEKVGELYEAYELAFSSACERGFKYVHLLQGDMQMLWWDDDARAKIAELYRRHPNCVNVFTRALSSDRTLTGSVTVDAETGDAVLRAYHLSDTGMFHLERWAASGVRFEATEELTSARAGELGLRTFVSPWPTEVPVPWPAVVRKGRQVGREVRTSKPYLCRPLGPEAVETVKKADYPVAWEDICVPWGWSCLTPMSETDLSKWYYLNYRWLAVRTHGWRAGAPRWASAGLDRRADLLLAPRRPPLWRLVLQPLPSLAGELARRVLSSMRRPRTPTRPTAPPPEHRPVP